jgi:hypothetical protein
MKLTVLKIAGAVLAMSLVALEIAAQSGGGFPSRPTFQQVTIGSTTSTSSALAQNVSGSGVASEVLNASTVDALCIVNNQTASTGPCTTPAHQLTIQTVTGSTLHLATAGGFSFDSGGLVLGAASSGNLGTGWANAATGYAVNGVAVPVTKLPTGYKVSYGAITQSAAATCSLLSPAAGGQNSNVASVACSVTGNTTVTFTSGYTTNPPSCVASINASPGANGPFVYETAFTTTTVTFEIFNAGAAANGFTYNFQCVGT